MVQEAYCFTVILFALSVNLLRRDRVGRMIEYSDGRICEGADPDKRSTH